MSHRAHFYHHDELASQRPTFFNENKERYDEVVKEAFRSESNSAEATMSQETIEKSTQVIAAENSRSVSHPDISAYAHVSRELQNQLKAKRISL
jgi:hypothetical protein